MDWSKYTFEEVGTLPKKDVLCEHSQKIWRRYSVKALLTKDGTLYIEVPLKDGKRCYMLQYAMDMTFYGVLMLMQEQLKVYPFDNIVADVVSHLLLVTIDETPQWERNGFRHRDEWWD